jgi:hypothetical protein
MKIPIRLARPLAMLTAIFLLIFYPILAFKFMRRGRPGSSRLFYRGILGITWLCILGLALYACIWRERDFIIVTTAVVAFVLYTVEGLSALNIISRLPESTYDKDY